MRIGNRAGLGALSGVAVASRHDSWCGDNRHQIEAVKPDSDPKARPETFQLSQTLAISLSRHSVGGLRDNRLRSQHRPEPQLKGITPIRLGMVDTEAVAVVAAVAVQVPILSLCVSYFILNPKPSLKSFR